MGDSSSYSIDRIHGVTPRLVGLSLELHLTEQLKSAAKGLIPLPRCMRNCILGENRQMGCIQIKCRSEVGIQREVKWVKNYEI